jgi:hypothetical protein
MGIVGASDCVEFEATSELILGNVADMSLSEMWQGERLQQLRTGDQAPERPVFGQIATCAALASS